MPGVPGFLPSRNGFAFPNWFPAGTPILELATPFGVVPLGDAHGGVCGGMIFACIDFFTEDHVPLTGLPASTGMGARFIAAMHEELARTVSSGLGLRRVEK